MKYVTKFQKFSHTYFLIYAMRNVTKNFKFFCSPNQHSICNGKCNKNLNFTNSPICTYDSFAMINVTDTKSCNEICNKNFRNFLIPTF